MIERLVIVEPLRIKATHCKAQPGDFEAAVEGGYLLLPEEVADAFASHGLRNASEVLSYLYTFPSAIAADLHWNVAEVLQALDVLRAKLRGRVDDEVVNPPERPRFGYGALNPALLKRRGP